MWGVVAEGLGVEPAPYPGHPDPLEPRTSDAPALWRAVAEREGLVEPDVDRLASWWHTDSDLGRQVETWADMTKSREAGFDRQQDSRRSFLDVFDRLRAERVLPPLPGRPAPATATHRGGRPVKALQFVDVDRIELSEVPRPDARAPARCSSPRARSASATPTSSCSPGATSSRSPTRWSPATSGPARWPRSAPGSPGSRPATGCWGSASSATTTSASRSPAPPRSTSSPGRRGCTGSPTS